MRRVKDEKKWNNFSYINYYFMWLVFLKACKKGPLSLDQQEELMTDVRGLLLNMEKQMSSWQLSVGKKEDGLCFLD